MKRTDDAANDEVRTSQSAHRPGYSDEMTTLGFLYAPASKARSAGLAARWRTIVALTAVVWGAMTVVSVLNSLHAISAQSLSTTLIWRPVFADFFGAALSAAVAFGLTGLHRFTILARALSAVAASLVAAVIFSFVAIGLIEPLVGPDYLADGFAAQLIRMTSLHIWVFAAHAGFFLLLDQHGPQNPDRSVEDVPTRASWPPDEDYSGLDGRWFWSFQAAFWSGLALFSIANSVNAGESPTNAWRILIAESGGFAVTCLAHYLLLRPTRFWALHKRAALALAISVVTAAFYIAGIFAAYYVIAPIQTPPSVANGDMTQMQFFLLAAPRWMFLNFPVFVGWSGFYLALDGARRLRAQEKRLYESMMLAKDAQVKMLRFQLNPHFLFNTLNAISSLLLDKRAEDADAMLGRLARFLRFALEVSPDDQTSLEDEIAAQRLYLEIEQIRFEERLRAQFTIDEDCAAALVPTLILQPLLENAVKYGVSRSSRPVNVRVSASRVADNRLSLSVTDDGGGAPHAGASGGGVGLSNVAARLRTLYGAEATLDYGPTVDNGFAVNLVLPFVSALRSKEGKPCGS
ncbi:sensor histidine kinase [Maricaulaceae bacterium MS644]